MDNQIDNGVANRFDWEDQEAQIDHLCEMVENLAKRVSDLENKKKKPRNKRPTLEEAKAYFKEKGDESQAQAFMDHHESKGWLVGHTKTPMKCWKAAVRTWLRNRTNVTNYNNTRTSGQANGIRPTESSKFDNVSIL